MIEEARLLTERRRLVGLCYRLTGNLDAAEDLAQETLLEALRNAHKLRDPSGLAPWLSAIARNVCRRWNHARGRDLAALVAPDDWGEVEYVDDGYDLEVELDRRELAALLDRALGLLPPESRQVLIERYIRESPIAEIAARLGLSEANTLKRLERGRLRLKRVLSTELLRDAAPHGLSERLYADWEETDMWCPVCGERRLHGRWAPSRVLWLICIDCSRVPSGYGHSVYLSGGSRGLLDGARSYAATHRRLAEEHDRDFGRGLAGRTWRCPHCAYKQPYRIGLDPWDDAHFAPHRCARCGRWSGQQFKLGWNLLASPDGQRFLAKHGRVRSVPEREIERDGVRAVVAGLESPVTGARLSGVYVRDTFQPIALHEERGG